MAPLLADHNLSRPLVRLLRDRGHDAVTSRELGLDRATDGLHLLTASSLDRVLLTHNERDFLLLHDAWLRWAAAWNIQPLHAGVIVLPQGQRSSAERSAREVEELLRVEHDQETPARLTNQLWVWRPARGWIEFSHLASAMPTAWS